jgi:hypothetical protein
MKSTPSAQTKASPTGASVIRAMAFLSLLVVAGPSSGCFWHERRDPDVERRRYDRDEHREREPRGERREERHEEREERRREEH